MATATFLALSRFKVGNGMAADVRDAFVRLSTRRLGAGRRDAAYSAAGTAAFR